MLRDPFRVSKAVFFCCTDIELDSIQVVLHGRVYGGMHTNGGVMFIHSEFLIRYNTFEVQHIVILFIASHLDGES